MTVQMHSSILIIKRLLLFACLTISAQETTPPKDVATILSHILKEQYLEVYKGQHYRVRIRGYAASDIDGDGQTEVFILIDPHYHQTAPIQIYRIQKNGVVVRIREGLAPGPLIKRDDQRLDAHILDLALDMADIKPPETYMKFAKGLSKDFHVVVYKKFIHADTPEDKAGFLDMTSRDEFPAQDTCENMQFSQPEGIEIGECSRLPGGKVLGVLVGNEIVVYRITNISSDGFLDKRSLSFPRPKGTKGIVCLPSGQLGVGLENGQELALAP